MYWWAYIIVWVVSWFVPFIITILVASLNDDESSALKIQPINPLLENSLNAIFATLNCIFCAILFGLK